VESSGVDSLEAGSLSPELPVGNNGWGDGNTQLLLVGEDTSGVIGSEHGRRDASKPTDGVEVVLTGPFTAEETACGELGGEGVEDQIAHVGDMDGGNLEETALGLIRDLVLVDLKETTVGGDLLVVKGLELGSFGSNGDALEGSLTASNKDSGDAASLSLELLIAPGQEEGKVGVVLILMDEVGEGGWLGHWRRGDRVQIGDNGFSVGVDARTGGQSGESALRVDLEEARLKVRAIHEVDGLELDIDIELSNGDLGNGSPDGMTESVESWLGHCWLIERGEEMKLK